MRMWQFSWKQLRKGMGFFVWLVGWFFLVGGGGGREGGVIVSVEKLKICSPFFFSNLFLSHVLRTSENVAFYSDDVYLHNYA